MPGASVARFLRADRDHHDDRQFAGQPRRSRLHGPAFAGLPRRAHRRRRARERHGRDRASLAPALCRSHERLSERAWASACPIEGEYYRTGDVASRDADGDITFIGRADDVFKSSDYRLSPFELESVLIEHAAIAEAAVVPAPDPVRYTIAKGYVALAQGHAPDRETAAAIFKHMRGRLSAYKLVRRIEFFELPKTVRGRSVGSNCASAKAPWPSAANARKRNSGSRIFRKGDRKRPRSRARRGRKAEKGEAR